MLDFTPMRRVRNLVGLMGAIGALLGTTAPAQAWTRVARLHRAAPPPAKLRLEPTFVATPAAPQLLDMALSGASAPQPEGSGQEISFFGGTRIHPRLAFDFGRVRSFHGAEGVESWYGRVSHVVLDGRMLSARLYLRAAGAITPFLQGGLGTIALMSPQSGNDGHGAACNAGGGVDVRVSETVSLGLRVAYTDVSLRGPSGTTGGRFMESYNAEGGVAMRF